MRRPARPYSSHDDAIIKEEIQAGKYWANRAAKKLDRHPQSVRYRAHYVLLKRGEITQEQYDRANWFHGQWKALSPTRIAEIRQRFAAGQTRAQVAAALGISYSTLDEHMKKHGIRSNARGGAPKLDPDTIGRIRKLMAAGYTASATAEYLGVSRPTVMHYARDLARRHARVWTPEEELKLKLLFYAGQSDEQIARALDRNVRATKKRRQDLRLLKPQSPPKE